MNAGSIDFSAPPRLLSTTAVRMTATRTPASTAGAAASSQRRVTSAMNPSASVGESSVITCAPWSPYPEMPFWARNDGSRVEAATASARVRVVVVRLSRKVRR